MKKRFLLLTYFLFISSILNAQDLYSILNWNQFEQKKNLIVWYDIQDLTTITKLDENNVLKINDKSIGGNNIFQAQFSAQPKLLKEFINKRSLMCLSFEGGKYMVYNFPTSNNVDEITSFVVGKNIIGGSRLLFDLSLEGGEGVASWYSGQNSIESRVPNSLATFTVSNNNDDLMLISTRGKSGDIESSLNELEYKGKGSRNFEGSKYNRIRLSTRPGDAQTNGKIYELILFNKKLTDEEYMKVKSYLISKYGLDKSHDKNSKFNSENFKVAENYNGEIKDAQTLTTSNISQSKLTDEFTYVRLGDIDVISTDLGELTYDDAKNAIKNLGEGWRLPNEKELILMFNNQDKIGRLSRRPFEVVKDYWIYAGNYLGEESTGELVYLRTLINPGYTIPFNKSNVQKRTFTYIRAVRDVPSNSIAKSSSQTNSSKNKSADSKSNSKGEASELDYVMPLILGSLKYSEKASASLRKTESKAESNEKCPVCWKKQDPKRRFDLEKDKYVWDTDSEMRPGSEIHTYCGGSGQVREIDGGNSHLKKCYEGCGGTGWIKCRTCDGTGFVKKR